MWTTGTTGISGKSYGIATALPLWQGTIEQIANEIRDIKNFEGVVAYSKRGLCKIKTKWYIKLHKITTNISRQEISKLYLNNKLDDIFPHLPDMQKERVLSIIRDIDKEILQAERIARGVLEKGFQTRKDLALFLQNSDIPKWLWKAIFDAYNGKPLRFAIIDVFKKRY